MEINGTEVPEMLVGDFVLDENAPRETEHVIHFFTPECHESISPSIQRSMTGPRATKTGFICSSDVLYSRVVDDPLIDLTGAVVTSLHFTSQPDFCVCPIGGFEARLANPEDVKLVILFGLVEWNERVRVRCLEKGFKTSFVQQLMSDQEDLLSRLKNVPVIGGDPTHGELSISTRGYLVTGRKISVHTKLLENSQNAGQVFHDLHEEVDQATARFSRPKFIGFVFGAFGSLLRHKAHYMNSSAWAKLQNEFPYVQFIGFSSTFIYSGEYPFMADSRNKTSITVIVMERY